MKHIDDQFFELPKCISITYFKCYKQCVCMLLFRGLLIINLRDLDMCKRAGDMFCLPIKCNTTIQLCKITIFQLSISLGNMETYHILLHP